MLHSEEYLNDSRIEWYNSDFLELIGKRLGLEHCSVIADVGCGLCHWSSVLSSHLKTPGIVYGIDREEEWLNRNLPLKATFARSGFELNFINSSAESIALADESCDLVTCQTLLIHVSNIEDVLSEFYRILKPGGLVLCSEPNNPAGSLIVDEADKHQSIEYFLRKVKFELAYAIGKEKENRGRTHGVESFPNVLQRVGFKDIKVYQSDKVELIQHQGDICETNDTESLESQEVYRLAKLGGVSEAELQLYRNDLVDRNRRINELKSRGGYLEAKGAIMYLISARRKN